MKHIVSTYTLKSSIADAVSEIRGAITPDMPSPKLLIFFASSNHDMASIAKEMERAFPSAIVIGCTTAGELASGKVLANSIVAGAFDDVAVQDAHLSVIENLSAGVDLTPVFASAEAHFQAPLLELDFKQYVGIILVDGLSKAEESLMDALLGHTSFSIVGGSAGDDGKFESTLIAANGKVYHNAAVLLILKSGLPFEIVKTQSFRITEHVLTANKVDEANRTVLEFNGKPAAIAYREALGIPGSATLEERFMKNPVGIVFDNEPFVRSPQKLNGDAMVFYCNIQEGTVLHILESQDIIADTTQTLKDAQAQLGAIQGMIQFNCILRTLELTQKGLADRYGQLFSPAPLVGFTTYGEQLFGHINQTATMLLFGTPAS
ncbi:hypothetical protein GTO91_04135 [Heliobacterium undosum]|uniref:FIST domain containing protein n=1 Tax=Heliomicrobium undosum TaxID=121734 RepID=A0A845L548_9FIRM|nr:FIST N-terminal domain-containing protein [Heliomicrobium undosum]MZP28898.1 hypothetical protein [Heliomicrobium undosum]